MRARRRKLFKPIIISIITVICLSLPSGFKTVYAVTGSPDPLSLSEREWLKDHPVIRLAPDPYFPPVEYLNENGQYAGIAADYIKLLEKKLGIKITIVHLKNWDEIVKAIQAREIDMLGGAYFSEERLGYLRYSKCYFSPPIVIINRDKVAGQLSMEKLAGMKVVVVNGFSLQETIKRDHPSINIISVPQPAEGLRIVSFGIADAMILDLATASYYIEQENIANLKVAGETSYDGSLYITTRKDWPELQTIINKGLTAISREEKNQINQRWINLKDGSLSGVGETDYSVYIYSVAVLFILMALLILIRNRNLSKEVSRQHQKEKMLEQKESRFRSLIADAPMLVIIYQDSKIVYANSSLEKFVGYRLEDHPNMNFWELIHPDFADQAREKGMARQRGEEVPAQYESFMLGKDGQGIPIDIFSKVIEYDGRPAVISFINDISARKQAEEELRRSEENYRIIFNTSGIAMLIYGEDSIITMVNQEFVELSGYSVQEIEGKKKWTDFVGKDDLERMMTYHKVRRISSGAAPPKYDFKFVDRRDNIKDMLISVNLMPGTKTSVVSLLDYSERKRAQEQIAYRLKIEQAIADISSLLLASGEDQMGKALRLFSDVLAVDCGYIYELNPGKPVFANTDFWTTQTFHDSRVVPPDLHPNQHQWLIQKMLKHETVIINNVDDFVPEARQEIKTLKTYGIKAALIIPFFSSSKGLLGFFGFAHLLEARQWKDEDTMAVVVISDLLTGDRVRRMAEQELRLSESRYRAVIEDQTELICRYEKNGALTFVNEAFCRFFQKAREELIGKPFISAIYEDDRYKFSNLLTTDFKPNNEFSFEIRAVKPSGELAWLECTGRAIVNDRAELIEFQIVGHDVTERKQLEMKLALQNKMEAIGQLAAGIAHEMNTPLQYVGDNVTFLRESFGDLLVLIGVLQGDLELSTESGCAKEVEVEKYRKMFGDLDIEYLLEEIPLTFDQTTEGLSRVRKLVLAMKDFSHPGMREKELSNVNQGIEATVAISKNNWKYHADVETDLDPDLPLLCCSIDQINQVILNMIINASDAIHERIENKLLDRGLIRIASRLEKDSIVISISDNGGGIPEAIRQRIYDPFFTTKAPGKGTGQGLAIVHDIIVVKHKGSLDMKSEEGQGTTFIIALPLNSD